MRVLPRDDHSIRLGLLSLVLALLYATILTPLGFFEGIRHASSDALMGLRNGLRKAPVENQELLLVVVDDESQRQMGQRWPWDRSVFAEFLKKVTPLSPKMILFDFAFIGAGTPASDGELARAIQAAPTVLLAAYLDPQGELMLPRAEFVQAGGIPCLINKPLDRDLVIRKMWTNLQLPGRADPIPSIELKAALCAGGTSLQKIPTGPLGEVPINYLSSPRDFPTLSFWKLLREDLPLKQIRNKILVVGSAREITHDVHPTPLGRMPGMVIEANGLVTFLTGRFLKTVALWMVLPFWILFTFGIAQMAFRMRVGGSLLCALGITVSAVAIGFLLCLNDYAVEVFGICVLAAAAWIVGIVYKYGILLASTLRLHQQVIVDPHTGGLTGRYFRLKLQEELEHASPLHAGTSLLLIQITPLSQLLFRASWEEARQHFRGLGETLQKIVPRKALIGHLQEDRLAVLFPRTSSSEAQKSALRMKAVLQPNRQVYAYGLASTDHIRVKSAEDLLRCAEAALHRAHEKGRGILETFEPSRDRVEMTERVESKTGGELEYVATEIEEKEKALEKAFTELRQAHQDMEAAFLEVTKSLVMALETKDAYTAGHLERVSRYATRLAEALELPQEEIEAIREAALLHDIGKIGLPDEVLHKVGALTDEERDIIKQHLSIGAKILEPMKFFRPITTLIYHHHERYDGKGYPHGLHGEFIPAGAQVIAIADSFDAMTTQRSYNKPMTIQEALTELKRGSGSQFNPSYVEKFIEVVQREGPHLAGHTT